MNSSPKPMPTKRERSEESFVGGRVRTVSAPANGDLSDWVELMDAVEALCPVWPPKEGIRTAGIYRL